MNAKTKLLSLMMVFAAIAGCLIACNNESEKELSSLTFEMGHLEHFPSWGIAANIGQRNLNKWKNE